MWIPLNEYCEKYSWPKLRTLRWIIWTTENAMEKQAPFITRFGKKVLIDGDMFQAWLSTKEAADCRAKAAKLERAKRVRKLTEREYSE